MRPFMRAAAAVALLIAFLAAAEEAPIPPLAGRVVDINATLTAEQKHELEASLEAFEKRKGSQIAVLITGTTFPEPIESFSLRVAEAWKIGRKGVDDGIVVVVARSDQAMRIEVGYGLEGAVPDAVAKRLIEEEFIPRFREGDFYGGLRAGLDRLMRVIDGEPLPPPKQEGGGSEPRSIETYFVLFMAIVIAVGGMLRALFGRLPAAAIVGFGTGLLAWLIVAPLTVALLVGIVGFIFTLAGGGHRGGLGGFGRGGFGGGGFGGGGFSGGGGGFGGGGASGRW
jgi:uncharacterized protein